MLSIIQLVSAKHNDYINLLRLFIQDDGIDQNVTL